MVTAGVEASIYLFTLAKTIGLLGNGAIVKSVTGRGDLGGLRVITADVGAAVGLDAFVQAIGCLGQIAVVKAVAQRVDGTGLGVLANAAGARFRTALQAGGRRGLRPGTEPVLRLGDSGSFLHELAARRANGIARIALPVKFV